ncbi:MAG TPA: hypothetical protein PKC73_02805 [Dermatophilaceae bacterium]|jgi:hypothetical protein|nr:hypothetical protein [Actinomycetales bacterium]HMT31463.1 hypothetical protein [Dermatophilaceae bacterium]HMT88544.1 hypothetical protein [Dermatophilaceae bacterium]
MSQSTGALRVQNSRPMGRAWVRPSSGRVSLRVVPAAIEGTGTGAFAAACLAVLVTGLLALLVLHTQLTQGSFTLHDLKNKSGALTDASLELNRSLDQQRSPANLAAKARAQGMVPATSMAFIRLAEGTIVGVAQPAPAAPVAPVAAPAPAPVAPAAAPAPAAPAPAATATTQTPPTTG